MRRIGIAVEGAAGGVTLLRLSGVVDRRGIPDLDRTIGRLVEEGRTRIVVDCRDLAQISSEGVGVFLSYLIKIRKTGGDIKFAALRPETRTVFRVLRIQNFVRMHETPEEAVQEFLGGEGVEEEEEQQLVIRVVPLDDVCVLHLRGFVDRHTIGQLEAALKQALKSGRRTIILNCRDLTYINSAGLGILIQYLKEARRAGGDICFCETQDSVDTLVSMLGLQNLYRFFPTEEEAVRACRRT